MKKNMIRILLSLICILAFIVPSYAGSINLSVAMSLKDVMAELTDAFSQTNPGAEFRSNLGGSGTIAKQVANGAPADMFFSANIKWMTFLQEQKIVEEKDSRIMAYNTLVFVGKPDSNIQKMQDIVKLEKISIGSPGSVPAGEYADQALEKAGIKKQLEKKLVMAKDVRTCLLYADRGDVDGSFVYRTDAEEMAKNVKILFEVPQELYPRVTYPMAMTVTGKQNPEVVDFFKFLQTRKAQEILKKHGFSIE